MNTKEQTTETLSDFIIDNCVEADEYDNMIPAYKVREFIKKLKDRFNEKDCEGISEFICNVINELAGKKLTEKTNNAE